MNPISILLFVLGTIFTFILLFKSKNRNNYLIIIPHLASVIISLFFNNMIGYYLYGLTILLTIAYPFYNKGMSKQNKIWLWVFIVPFAIRFIFILFHFPYVYIVNVSMLIPIIVFIYMVINYKKFTSELSILTLFFVHAITNSSIFNQSLV